MEDTQTTRRTFTIKGDQLRFQIETAFLDLAYEALDAEMKNLEDIEKVELDSATFDFNPNTWELTISGNVRYTTFEQTEDTECICPTCGHYV